MVHIILSMLGFVDYGTEKERLFLYGLSRKKKGKKAH
jgi:hypothetical protein